MLDAGALCLSCTVIQVAEAHLAPPAAAVTVTAASFRTCPITRLPALAALTSFAGGYCMLVGATLKPRTVMDLAAGLVLNITA